MICVCIMRVCSVSSHIFHANQRMNEVAFQSRRTTLTLCFHVTESLFRAIANQMNCWVSAKVHHVPSEWLDRRLLSQNARANCDIVCACMMWLCVYVTGTNNDDDWWLARAWAHAATMSRQNKRQQHKLIKMSAVLRHQHSIDFDFFVCSHRWVSVWCVQRHQISHRTCRKVRTLKPIDQKRFKRFSWAAYTIATINGFIIKRFCQSMLVFCVIAFVRNSYHLNGHFPIEFCGRHECSCYFFFLFFICFGHVVVHTCQFCCVVCPVRSIGVRHRNEV